MPALTTIGPITSAFAAFTPFTATLAFIAFTARCALCSCFVVLSDQFRRCLRPDFVSHFGARFATAVVTLWSVTLGAIRALRALATLHALATLGARWACFVVASFYASFGSATIVA